MEDDNARADRDSPGGPTPDPTQIVPALVVSPLLAEQAPVSEFVCPGCGRPLAITLRSDMCFAEAQVYCADCERDYQERRGRWAPGTRGEAEAQ